MHDVSTIHLEAGIKAHLDWSQAIEAARDAIEKGYLLRWHLDLGLFNQLAYPLSHRSQFLSLSLSIQHFLETIWPIFKENTQDILLYKGSADYSHLFNWEEEQKEGLKKWLENAYKTIDALNEESDLSFVSFEDIHPVELQKTKAGRRWLALFCRDVSVDYLNLLIAHIPDEIPLTIELDVDHSDDFCLQAQLTARDKYERAHLKLSKEITQVDAPIAVCLPPSSLIKASAVQGLHEAMQKLQDTKQPFKIIPETFLITEWDELNVLIVTPQGVSSEGRRKLLGFCAAGGLIVTLDNLLMNLPNEVLFSEWSREIAQRNNLIF